MRQGTNRLAWLSPSDPPGAFPPLRRALREPAGLLAAGGDLSSNRLLHAYRAGIFPWYEAGQPILWWSPDPRCVLKPAGFHIARRFRRDLAQSNAVLTVNRSFGAVIRACAAPRRSQQGTWITDEMMAAYERLHREGWAHSIEIWNRERLVGGIYGLAIGRVFFGESMFSKESNASKIALLGLCRMLERHAFELIDCQAESPHLIGLGAERLRRSSFAAILEAACDPPNAFENWPETPIPVRELNANRGNASLQ